MNNDINKYHNGKIYTIRSPQTDKYYIGSTTQPLYKRFYEHKRDYKLFLDGKFNNISSFEILKFDDCYIELLEQCKCDNKEQLTKREGQLIRLYINDIVNKRVEGRTKQEHYIDNKEDILEKRKEYAENHKEQIVARRKIYYDNNKEMFQKKNEEYREINKDKLKEHNKIYRLENKERIKIMRHTNYLNNKEKILANQKVKINCECGKTISKNNLADHRKTIFHQNYIKSLNPII